jgi:hypothetical protein
MLDGAVLGAESLYSFVSKLPRPPERRDREREGHVLTRLTAGWGCTTKVRVIGG